MPSFHCYASQHIELYNSMPFQNVAKEFIQVLSSHVIDVPFCLIKFLLIKITWDYLMCNSMVCLQSMLVIKPLTG